MLYLFFVGTLLSLAIPKVVWCGEETEETLHNLLARSPSLRNWTKRLEIPHVEYRDLLDYDRPRLEAAFSAQGVYEFIIINALSAGSITVVSGLDRIFYRLAECAPGSAVRSLFPRQQDIHVLLPNGTETIIFGSLKKTNCFEFSGDLADPCIAGWRVANIDKAYAKLTQQHDEEVPAQ
jgi:hypothetical protein